MHRRYVVAIGMILAAAAASCAVDPERAKQQYMDEGDSLMSGKKYSEAVISYRNAVRQDERFGEGRFKLAEAYLAAGDARNGLERRFAQLT